MADSRWKDALWKLLDVVALRRITARVALSAGLVGLATQGPSDSSVQPRVPVAPAFVPDQEVRKLKGKYILKRAANSFFVHLAGHRSHSSHSSHSSHGSHRSHSSSSHYSGAHASHYSSSATPAPPPEPVTAPPPPPRKVVETPPPKPEPLLRETFNNLVSTRWRVDVIATPPETFDAGVLTTHMSNALTITPLARQDGTHFSGFASTGAFDLNSASVAAELRRAASGGTTIFAAVIDAQNWIGFRIEGGRLSLESHTAGKVAARTVTYDAAEHRYLRLRTSSVAPVVVWETSADGSNWNPEYVETATIKLASLRIALSAGTTKRIESTGAAVFDNVLVEQKR